MGKSEEVFGGYLDLNPVHTVTLSSFYMGKYEVTQDQYRAVMGSNRSIFSSSPASGEVQGKRPVENVNWFHAIVFCNKLSILEGLTPAYSINDSTDPSSWGSVPTSVNNSDRGPWDRVTIVSGSTGYRLPTEAQWEYAAKGGKNGNIYSRDGMAWYSSNSNSITHEVGKKYPNGLGLYDMLGNVWEWCWDWREDYSSELQTDPQGPSLGVSRVRRGGSWSDTLQRSIYRYGDSYYDSYNNGIIGFRVVRPLS